MTHTGRMSEFLVPGSIRKMATTMAISTTLLEEYSRTPSPEELARWRAEEQARHTREDARHAELIAAGGVTAAVAGLHSPDASRCCTECQDGDFMASWPCTTWQLLDEKAPNAPGRPS